MVDVASSAAKAIGTRQHNVTAADDVVDVASSAAQQRQREKGINFKELAKATSRR